MNLKAKPQVTTTIHVQEDFNIFQTHRYLFIVFDSLACTAMLMSLSNHK